MKSLAKRQNEEVWFLTALGVVSGTLELFPENRRDPVKVRNATWYVPGKPEKPAGDVSLSITQIVSWGLGFPSFVNLDQS